MIAHVHRCSSEVWRRQQSGGVVGTVPTGRGVVFPLGDPPRHAALLGIQNISGAVTKVTTALLIAMCLAGTVALASRDDAVVSGAVVPPHGASGALSQQESLDSYLQRLRLGTKASVVVVFSAQEPRALQQVEFYRRLLEVSGMDGTIGRFILFTRDGVAPAVVALKDRNFKAHTVGSYPAESGGLPTAMGSVAILDSAGLVLKSWSGFPAIEQQTEVVRFLEKTIR